MTLLVCFVFILMHFVAPDLKHVLVTFSIWFHPDVVLNPVLTVHQ